MLLLGVSWVMTSLTDNPVLVSMVQTMTSLPFLFFSIPAGVAADALGYRRVLLAAQLWMLAMTAVLAVIALPGWWDLQPVPLLAVLFLIGIGVVVAQAAWKPFLNDLVGEDDLMAAISLNSLSNRIAQLLGPVLGGYLMGLAGIAALLFTRVLSHAVMITALLRVPRDVAVTAAEPRVGVRDRIRDGWRAVSGSAHLYGPMIRCVALMVPCGAVLALLPLEAKENIQTGAIGYGGLLAALGLGTTLGVTILPVLQRFIRLNPLSTICVAVFALAAPVSRKGPKVTPVGQHAARRHLSADPRAGLEHARDQPSVRGAVRRSARGSRIGDLVLLDDAAGLYRAGQRPLRCSRALYRCEPEHSGGRSAGVGRSAAGAAIPDSRA